MTRLTETLADHRIVSIGATDEMMDVGDMCLEAGRRIGFTYSAMIEAAPDFVITDAVLREAFETWAKKKKMPLSQSIVPEFPGYSALVTEYASRGFRAAFQLLADNGWVKMEDVNNELA